MIIKPYSQIEIVPPVIRQSLLKACNGDVIEILSKLL